MNLIKKERIFDFILFSYFSLLPLIFFGTLSDPFLLPRQLLTVVLLSLIYVVLVTKNKMNELFILDKAVLFFFGFIFFCIISFSQSHVLDLSHVTLSKYLVFFLFFLLLRHLILSHLVEISKIYFSAILFGIISIVITILAFANKTINNQILFSNVDIMSGTFGNKNFLSSILFFLLPFYFVGTLATKKVKLISITAILLTIILLIMLRTRTVLIALIIYFFLIVFYHLKEKFSKKIANRFLLFTLIIIPFVIWFVVYIKSFLHSSSDMSIQYFYRLFSTSTLFSRIEFWNQSICIIKDNFFTGIGLGNWTMMYPKYGLYFFENESIVNGRMIITNPHNDFLYIFSEIGFLGLLCYLGLFITILYQAFWLTKNQINTAERKKTSYFLFFILSYLIIAFFDFPLTRIEHQVILLIIFSLINSKYLLANKTTSFKIPYHLHSIFIFSSLLYCTVITVSAISGGKHIFKGFQAERRLDNKTSVAEFNKAKMTILSIDDFGFPVDWHIAKALYNEGKFKEALEFFKYSYSKNQYNIIINNDLASTYVKNNNTKNAIKHYNEALKISPNYEDARINLAATYFNIQDYNAAFVTIDQCKIDSKNENYLPFLTRIVEKKINTILNHHNNSKLNARISKIIKTQNDLLKFYFDSKINSVSFEKFILTYK